MTVGSSEKASHYISLLDAARVNASWSEFPELIRKVNKHAPQRKVLIHTATAEHEVATGSRTSSLSTLATTLQSEGTQDVQESFQGKTCLLWSRWLTSSGGAAVAGLDTVAAVKSLDGQNVTTWSKICIIKSAYIEGTNYMRNGRPTEAQRVYDVALLTLQSNKDLVQSTPQLAYWAEQLLAQKAMGKDQQEASRTTSPAQMEAFRYWGIIAAKTREVSASTYGNTPAHLSRFAIWKKYYELASAGLERQIQDSTNTSNTTRLQQATELRKVEQAYENELLRTIKFPHATEMNAVVGQWVEQAVRNWRILCGSQWRDSELGEGGRNAVARNMLDILYRAASKTFHSTLILRRLFQVHLSLSEFDLAYRAFDTYMELVDRGRERVAKSEKPEAGHESDEAVLATIAEAIGGLCKYGRQPEARKAYALCAKLEDYLISAGIEKDETNGVADNHFNRASTNSTISPRSLQIVYRAIGTGRANWARWTPTSEDRSELQEDALANLRKACVQSNPEVESLYATSLLLAETRDITSAIKVAKQALASYTSPSKKSSGWSLERKLVSQWHLLALLLTSRQDFDSAAKSCEAAFEQFASGDIEVGTGRNSSVSSSIEKQFAAAVSNLTDEMECDELERIVEVRITELALTELTNGPEEAVNNSNELLGLFSRLFSHVQIPLETSTVNRSLAPPKSSAGTVKTARTSIFGRKKHDNQAETIREKTDDMASVVTNTTRPSTRATLAPTIQVTNEDERSTSRKHHVRKSYDSSHSKATTDGGSKRLSHRSHHNKRSQPNDLNQSLDQPGTALTDASSMLSEVEELPTPNMPLEHERSIDSKQELPEVNHNLESHDKAPPPTSHNEQPPHQDVRLPTLNPYTNATSPSPRFPKAIAQRQALTILTKVWLVIATLYRRASMFEDSKEACEEAGKAATKIEAIVGAIDHSARAFAEAGWGAGSKSADEVWADVYCERAQLQLAIHNLKIKEGQATKNEELRTAVEQFEQCLMFVPNHPAGVIGLSNVLLDFYERKVDLGKRINDGKPHIQSQSTESEHPPSIVVTSDSVPPRTANGTAIPSASHHDQPPASTRTEEDLKKTPENLNRIAARDRAYGLLSTLTKLGTGWDNSEAWFALARAHELGGEIEKAKSILWWCVELEDTKPIRHWRNLGYSI